MLALKINTETRILNISSERETSINELYALLKKLTGHRGNAIHEPAIAIEVKRISLNNSQAKEALGWSPKTELEQGLKKTVQWFKHN